MTRSTAELYAAIATLRVRQQQLRDRLARDKELDVVWALADERGERIQELERECERLRSQLARRG
jgi:hypothetical protein